ncbi:6-phosphogluconate dehydrogenase, decarboxylating 3 [Olea europaea subsp. europaea]|uniref:phosphogluconate dehydrogenase (NADP(+)-dependent, decarboxylating) n=1 Tax=Olea europaea subsp. europaea TaxID=158383 RepID=A0A8S0PW88_OLEEU|nr:6-phosphogluconate dehydrogenase, decarboxylating 3 [Olea europaea subsp. europaea]
MVVMSGMRTQRREKQMSELGLLYLGMGVSGGKESARYGFSLMPGGSVEAYKYIEHILLKVSQNGTKGELLSFLIEITADIFGIKDDKGNGHLVVKVLDKTGMKGTGKWTVQQAADLSIAGPMIASSLESRFLSGLKELKLPRFSNLLGSVTSVLIKM